MPLGFIAIVLIMGLFVVASCFFMPREIGKEDEPLVNARIDLPRMEDIAARVHEAKSRFREHSHKRPVAEAAAPPSAMGAPQPVLSQEPPESLVLPVTE